ncbi:hypothetical protein V7S43_019051 [Phytophthora oleae]|uniref:Transposase Tc1-like domain-containing protein n=1 Tax=Phytophthora oleae TaxID=2107226 RepID=A0ABD3FS91_9STRA
MTFRTQPPKPNLSTKERKDVVVFLLMHAVRGLPDRGAMRQAAAKFRVDTSTISMVWSRFKTTFTRDGIDGVASRIAGASGRKRADRDDLLERIAAIPFRRRMTQQSLPSELGVARSVVRDAVAQGKLLHHSSTIHPLLTKENKHARIRHAIRHVIHGPEGSHFSPMYNVVHVNEKWFNEDTDRESSTCSQERWCLTGSAKASASSARQCF